MQSFQFTQKPFDINNGTLVSARIYLQTNDTKYTVFWYNRLFLQIHVNSTCK